MKLFHVDVDETWIVPEGFGSVSHEEAVILTRLRTEYHRTHPTEIRAGSRVMAAIRAHYVSMGTRQTDPLRFKGASIVDDPSLDPLEFQT
jgi:hypothetical protein